MAARRGSRISEADLQGIWTGASLAPPATPPSAAGGRGEDPSGVFEGRITGTSIGLLIRETPIQRSKELLEIKDLFRLPRRLHLSPGSTGQRDYRGGGPLAPPVRPRCGSRRGHRQEYLKQVHGHRDRGLPLPARPHQGGKGSDESQIEQNLLLPDAGKLEALDEYMRAPQERGQQRGAKAVVARNITGRPG